MSDLPKRTYVVNVEDRPGVLNRVASLFRRRAFNIESLNVARTHQPGVSRLTVVAHADDDTSARIEANLYKMVNVLRVDELTNKPRVERGLALIKVKAGPDKLAEIQRICDVFRARVVDLANKATVVEISGTPDKINGLVDLLEAYGIADMVLSGTLAMTRSAQESDRVDHLKHSYVA